MSYVRKEIHQDQRLAPENEAGNEDCKAKGDREKSVENLFGTHSIIHIDFEPLWCLHHFIVVQLLSPAEEKVRMELETFNEVTWPGRLVAVSGDLTCFSLWNHGNVGSFSN